MFLIAAAVLTLAACAPQTAAERAYFEQKQEEIEAKQSLKNKLIQTTLKDTDIINMVSSNAAPDSLGNTDDWIKRQIGSIEGQILFPRWKVLRHGETKYEVQYAFSVIDEQNRIVKRGYAWDVDAIIKVVTLPREMKFTEQAPVSIAPTIDNKQRHRIRDEEASIE